MNLDPRNAPGKPGIQPTWTSSAKTGVGTAFIHSSHVWFTLSHGIFDEIYYPRVDQACTRDMGMIVTDGQDFFSEEKRDTTSQVEYIEEGVPAYRLTNTDRQGRYCIVKEIIADPDRDSVLQWTRFIPLIGKKEDYHLYVLLAPHLGNQGMGNIAWVGDYKGVPMLFAQRDGYSLALACSTPWLKRSVGFVGVSDGWQDLNQHKQMAWSYTQAQDGNVALTGEIDLLASDEPFLLALAFGTNDAEAGQRARASLLDNFDKMKALYIRQWQDWQNTLLDLHCAHGDDKLYRISMSVLMTHEAKHFSGGMIASLSIPWGFDKGDDDLGGYHLVWPRDLVEAVGGLLAAATRPETQHVLDYLQVTQEADGHWPQNMWLDGTAFWKGMQMDETAFPILLVDMAGREGIIDQYEQSRYWPMVLQAARFLVLNGPVTQEDRWEEDPGYSPFTLAVEIAALLVAADLAERRGEYKIAKYLRETADNWNANIERWIYVTGAPLAQQIGVEGYYVRIAPPDEAEASSPAHGYVPIKNRPPGESEEPAAHIVSPDALALVRFGLRSADDPRIVNTVKVIDALLKVETPTGPAWHRYNDDGYGENADGSPYDGTGIGRCWPLLTGERAHYELAAGRIEQAEYLRDVMASFANEGGMLSEQIWDAGDIPDKELFFGKPTGSAMPLVWAHAEYIKLCRSLEDQKVFDMPVQTVQRYLVEKQGSPFAIWCFHQKIRKMEPGKTLRIEAYAPGIVHWSADGWETSSDIALHDPGLGIFLADLSTHQLHSGNNVQFTFYWTEENRWEENNYKIEISPIS